MEDIDIDTDITNGTAKTKVINLQPLQTDSLIATLVILCPVVLLVISSNLLVIVAIFHDRSLRKPHNIFVASLAVVDLSIGILVLPLNILNIVLGGWPLGRFMCKLYVTMDVTLCCMSIQHLCVIAVDRYRAINDGIRYIQQRTFKTVMWAIGAICILSILMSAPPLLGWDENWMKDTDKTKLCDLLKSRGYAIYLSLGSIFLPMLFMVYFYTKIYYALRRKLREKATITLLKPSMSAIGITVEQTEAVAATIVNCDYNCEVNKNENFHERSSKQFQDFIASKQRLSLTKEKNATRTLGMIMGAFFICWLPFFVMYISVVFLPQHYQPSRPLVEFFVWLGYLNSALNPIIYAIFNLEFRKALKKMLHIGK